MIDVVHALNYDLEVLENHSVEPFTSFSKTLRLLYKSSKLENCQFLDYEWYKALKDSKLKDEALRNKAIMEGFNEDDDESHNKREELCEVHKLLVCNVRRYMMIKYSFNNDEEYVVVKEDEYDDLTITREEACRAYQEIFQIMNEGWIVTKAE
ncbi:hypothetical protein Tco_1256051 [Tanacetum coccineum]